MAFLAPEITRLRQRLAQERDGIQAAFLADLDPAKALQNWTETVDSIIEELFVKSLSNRGICLLATGGYGRRELFPFSDIDLLVILGNEPDPELEEKVKGFIQAVWDLGLEVGHQAWSWSDLEELKTEQFEFVFALLDGRPLAGDPAMARTLLEEFLPDFLALHRADVIAAVLEEVERRHLAAQDTIYQLEPDLKQSPGGLRDHLVGHWLRRLTSSQAFLPFGEGALQDARLFLSRLRMILHFQNGRDINKLTHRRQESTARALGFGGGSIRSGIESLMKEYFLHARVIHRFLDQQIRWAGGGNQKVLEQEEAPAIRTMSDVVAIFDRAVGSGAILSDELCREISKVVPLLSENLSYPSLGEPVLALFKPRPGLYRVLTQMYELGLLEILFPEFGTIRARVVRDFYHHYTVDEHSLLTIRAVEELADGPNGIDERFRGILQEAGRPAVLTLALLLHDVGKSRGGKHVDSGARMAAKALGRFRLPGEVIDAVVFLIRNHLAMSAVIFRRELSDETVVGRFADLVGDPETLRLLSLLTYADIKAVGPETINAWKRDRLWQLYVNTYNKLTLGYGEERIEDEDIGDKLRAGLPRDLDAEGFEDFLEGLPLRYLQTNPAAEIYQHCRLGRRLSAEAPVQTLLNDRGPFYELCVVTGDAGRLFSRIVGLLAYFDMNIVRGYAFSNRRRVILDFFQFEDTRGTFRLNPQERERFVELLRKAVLDEVSVEELLRGKEQSLVYQKPSSGVEATAYFEDEIEKSYSILEIVAPDSLGLLYRISRVIAGHGCNIELVLISTEGGKAVDVFYLTRDGGPLTPGLKEQLGREIIESIG